MPVPACFFLNKRICFLKRNIFLNKELNFKTTLVKKLKNILKWIVALFFASTILAVVAYRFIPVYFTPLMFIRCMQTGSLTMHHHWVPLDVATYARGRDGERRLKVFATPRLRLRCHRQGC